MAQKHLVSILTAGILVFTGCIGCNDKSIADTPFSATTFEVSHFRTDKTAYGVGETVSCEFKMENNTKNEVSVREVSLKVTNLSDPAAPIIYTKTILADRIDLKAASTQTFTAANVFVVPADAPIGNSYGINLSFNFEEGLSREVRASFIRIADEQTLLTYRIDRTTYHGLDIFTLDGGMSPEFAVEKSLAGFACGISHSWKKLPDNLGSGPYPVLMTTDFISRSVKKTVEMYNEVLGENKPVKNVVIGTATPSVTYLANSLQAVYLPIHFLGASQTAQEMLAALNHANETGYPSYATLGYDGSMENYGVAWHKLLDLPEEYRKFLIDHQVENVILFGVGQEEIGESWAAKVITEYNTDEYGPRSLYLLYTNAATEGDIAAITARISDYKTLPLQPPYNIADWESGIVNRQVTQFAKTIHEQTAANVYSLTCPRGGSIDVWNLASNLSTHSIYKNRAILDAPHIKRVALNEYLFAQPQYEIIKGTVPLLFWQFVDLENIINRVMNVPKAPIARLFPTIVYNNLDFYIDSEYRQAQEKDAIVARGVSAANINGRGHQVEWNPSDGMLAPCELAADDIVNNIGVAAYKAKQQAIAPLTIEELTGVCSELSGIRFQAR